MLLGASFFLLCWWSSWWWRLWLWWWWWKSFLVDAPSPNPHCFLSVKTDQCGAVFCGVLVVLMPLSGSTLHWWRQNSPLVEATSKAAPAAPKPAPTSHPMLCFSATDCSKKQHRTRCSSALQSAVEHRVHCSSSSAVVLFLINCSVPTSHLMLFCSSALQLTAVKNNCIVATSQPMLCSSALQLTQVLFVKKQHPTQCSAAVQLL